MLKINGKLAIVIIALFGIFTFFSCEKNEESFAKADTDEVTQKANKPWGIHRKWDSDFEECFPVPVDCFDEVVIIGSKLNIYKKLIEYTRDNHSELFFQNEDWKLVFPELGNFPEHLEMLKKGTVKLKYIERTQAFPGYYSENGDFAFAYTFVIK